MTGSTHASHCRSQIRLIIDYENVSKRRHNSTSSDGRMSKVTMAMDVDAIALSMRCRC